MNVALTGNNGELRSGMVGQKQTGLFAGLFGGTSSSMDLLPETRALDAALERKQARKPFKVKPEFEPQEVQFTGYSAGTIVIDTSARRLYLVESPFTARRYAIAVGKEGLQFKGTVAVGDKQEWPRWIPTLDMQKREPEHYAQYKDGMPGGGDNPLGARAIYLYDGKKDTHLRIHGTIAPQTIGTSASNGCFRMINEHVMDLYRRVRIGTKVVII
jgi:lipoprotein-anchoring transpeptidase ErfK/SrfK